MRIRRLLVSFSSVSLAVLATVAVGLQPVSAPGEQVGVQADQMARVGAQPPARPEASVRTLDVPSADRAESAPNRLSQRVGGADLPIVATLTDERTANFGMLGVTWEAGTASEDLVIEVRTRHADQWTTWQHLEIEDQQASEVPTARTGTAPTWVGDSDGVEVRLLSAHAAPAGVELELIDGGKGFVPPAASAADDLALMATTTESGVAPKPTIVSRKQWGVDRSYESECSSPIAVPAAKGIVLHHTAGANGYTREEAPGIVRGIHLYHTRSLGWCDIGYNFLVDAFGTVYAGRRGGDDRQVRGAHAGNWEANTYLTGISMVGNYETTPVPQATKTAVVALSAWRLSSFGLRASGKVSIAGKSIDVISGHRDIYLAGIRPATATACPGRYGIEWLKGSMRTEVQARIDAAPAVVPTEPSAPPVAEPSEEPVPDVVESPGPIVGRISGSTRYATAAAISAQTFPTRDGSVFLASGESFPDALSGGPAAASMSSPILLTAKDEVPAETIAEIERLAPNRIYILGGELTISPAVASKVATLAERVIRLDGRDRYAAGVRISRAFWPSAGTVYIASGSKYPDALSGGALAARKRAPILLSDAARLPDVIKSELVRLNPSRVVVLGGPLTLSSDVERDIQQALPAASVSRLQGRDRYETSAVIAAAGWRSANVAYFAAGTNFPDALAGVPAAAVNGAPLLLTSYRCMPAPIADVASSLGEIDRVLLGGPLSLRARAVHRRCA